VFGNGTHPLEGRLSHLHILVFKSSSESGIVDSIPVAEVKVLVDGLVELALGKLFSVLSQLFFVKFFGKILGRIDKVLLR